MKDILIHILDPLLVITYPLWITILLLYHLATTKKRNHKANPDSLRIAILTSALPPKLDGGISGAHYHLYCLLCEQNIETKLFSFNYQEQHFAVENMHCITQLNDRIRFIKHKLWYYNFTFFKRILGKSAYQISDIVQTFFGTRKLRKALLDYNPSHIVCSDQGIPGMFLPSLLKAKRIVYVHHNPARFYRLNGKIMNSLMDINMAVWFEKQFYKKAEALLFPSEYMHQTIKQTHTYKGRYKTLFNIVDYERLDRIKAYTFKEIYDFAVYIPSAGSEIKGSQYVKQIILNLCNLIPDKKLLFYLSGSIPQQQASDLNQIGTSNAMLFMPGHTSFEENMQYVKTCDICISPTLIENFSMALLEANYLGLPVVTFNTGGNNEIIEDGKNGFIVEKNDVDTMIRKTVYGLIHKHEFIDCSLYIRNKFNIKIFLKEFKELCRSI